MSENEIGSKRWPAPRYSHPVKEEKRAYRLTRTFFSATAYQIKAYHECSNGNRHGHGGPREGNQCDYKYQVDCVCTGMQIGGQTARQFVSMGLDWQVKEFTSTFVSCKRLAGWYGIILNLNAVPLGRKLSND